MSQFEEDQAKVRMKNFEDQYAKLQQHLDTYGDPQPWLRFKIQSKTDTETIDNLLIDTFTSTATVFQYGSDKTTIVPIMLTNFEYKKNGAGSANSFSISFAFNPAEKAANTGELIDPSIIDKALVVNSYFTEGSEDGSYRAVETIAKHRCYMQYGYNFGNDQMLSPEYFGQALHAKTELRDGLLYYTITGYSSLTYLVQTKIDPEILPDRGQKRKDENGNESVWYGWKTSDAMWKAIWQYFGEDNPKRDENNPSFKSLFSGITIKITNELDEIKDDDTEVFIEKANGTENLMEYLNRVAAGAKLKRNEGRQDGAKMATIEWKIVEEDDTLEFVIYLVDPVEDEKLQDGYLNTRMVDVVFEYPTRSNNIVKSFTPDFKFEEIWTRDTYLFSNNEDAMYFISTTGEVKAIQDMGYADAFADPEAMEIKQVYNFAQAMQNKYNANMTTIGIPADMPIGTVIYICPVINGRKYHYAGYYMILNTTDRIDTNGYTSEFQLFKLSAERKMNAGMIAIKEKQAQLRKNLSREKKDWINQYNKTNGTYYNSNAVEWTENGFQIYNWAAVAMGPNGQAHDFTNSKQVEVINKEGLKQFHFNNYTQEITVYKNGKPVVEKINTLGSPKYQLQTLDQAKKNAGIK